MWQKKCQNPKNLRKDGLYCTSEWLHVYHCDCNTPTGCVLYEMIETWDCQIISWKVSLQRINGRSSPPLMLKPKGNNGHLWKTRHLFLDSCRCPLVIFNRAIRIKTIANKLFSQGKRKWPTTWVNLFRTNMRFLQQTRGSKLGNVEIIRRKSRKKPQRMICKPASFCSIPFRSVTWSLIQSYCTIDILIILLYIIFPYHKNFGSFPNGFCWGFFFQTHIKNLWIYPLVLFFNYLKVNHGWCVLVIKHGNLSHLQY